MSTQPQYRLSPSDFAFLWEDCKYCYYQKVKYGISHSGVFPSMFGRINKLLQDSIVGRNLQEVHPDLPSGIITAQEGFMKSLPLGDTGCFISGRFDILSKLEDGTFAVIDFKIANPETDKILKKYKSQLHAYKYALENPQENESIKVTKMGVVTIHPVEMVLNNSRVVFTTNPTWHPIEEDMDSFYSLIDNISKVLNGPLPESSPNCNLCNYRKRFESTNAAIDDLPF